MLYKLKLQAIDANALGKLATPYIIYLVLYAVLTSSKLGYFLQMPYVGPVGFNAFPLVLIVILLGFLFMSHHTEISQGTTQRPSRKYCLLVGGIFLLILAFSFWATHPPIDRYEAMHNYIRLHPITGGPLLAATLYVALFLPFPVLLLLFLPWATLPALRKAVLFGSLLFIAYLYANVVEAYFHLAVSPTVFGAVQFLIENFAGPTSSLPSHLRLQLHDFSVVIGPVCTGFSMFTLFLGLFLYMWHENKFEMLRAVLALSIGVILLFLLNIVRIAAIVIVGAKFPGMGVALFHGTIGSLLFFAVFMAYLFWVTPLLRTSK